MRAPIERILLRSHTLSYTISGGKGRSKRLQRVMVHHAGHRKGLTAQGAKRTLAPGAVRPSLRSRGSLSPLGRQTTRGKPTAFLRRLGTGTTI